MSFETGSLLRKITELTDLAGRPERLVVAYSGGLDSTVLLHALAETRQLHQIPIVAVHVNHDLHSDSGLWSQACLTFAKTLDIDCESRNVDVDVNSGQGIEAAARLARYEELSTMVRAGDWLLSAHHRDDQAETLLLNLMRGSGPAGLAGIGEVRPFASAWLMRPLLSVSRSELMAYADANGLDWIDDPSNEDRKFDRNYLRHEVIPLLDARWPDAAGRLQRSSVLAGEASQLLDQLADQDFNDLGGRPDRLLLEPLRALPVERQRNVLRYVIRELGLPAPPASPLHSIVTHLIPARDDAQPLVRWTGAEIRRYREHVYLLPALTPPGASPVHQADAARFVVAAGMGELELLANAPSGLSDEVVAAGLELRFRQGGEEIKPIDQSHTRKLKKLLQEEGVVPWMRERLPLLYSGEQLVAVADLWIAAGAASEPGFAIRWNNRPAIH